MAAALAVALATLVVPWKLQRQPRRPAPAPAPKMGSDDSAGCAPRLLATALSNELWQQFQAAASRGSFYDGSNVRLGGHQKAAEIAFSATVFGKEDHSFTWRPHQQRRLCTESARSLPCCPAQAVDGSYRCQSQAALVMSSPTTSATALIIASVVAASAALCQQL